GKRFGNQARVGRCTVQFRRRTQSCQLPDRRRQRARKTACRQPKGGSGAPGIRKPLCRTIGQCVPCPDTLPKGAGTRPPPSPSHYHKVLVGGPFALAV